MLLVSQSVHVDAADHITMALKATLPALPDPALGLVFVLAYRTLAGCPSFGASEALDAGLFALVSQIIDIPAVLPLGHALVVMASLVLPPDAMWVADEERADLLASAELDHLPGGFVT